MLRAYLFGAGGGGVRQAVDEYMRNRLRQELHLMPIGDGISIAVCGF